MLEAMAFFGKPQALARLRAVWLAAIALSLAGCAAVQPPIATQVEPAQVPIHGRFSVQVTDSQGQLQAWQGSFRWLQSDEQISADFLSPLGAQVAELQIAPGSARLIDAQGRVWQDRDPDALMLQVTGVPMPVRSLIAWLQPGGEPASAAIDAQGWLVESVQTGPDRRRIQARREDGRGNWQVRVLLP